MYKGQHRHYYRDYHQELRNELLLLVHISQHFLVFHTNVQVPMYMGLHRLYHRDYHQEQIDKQEV